MPGLFFVCSHPNWSWTKFAHLYLKIFSVLLVHNWIWNLPPKRRIKGLRSWFVVFIRRIGILPFRQTGTSGIRSVTNRCNWISHYWISARLLRHQLIWRCPTKNVVSIWPVCWFLANFGKSQEISWFLISCFLARKCATLFSTSDDSNLRWHF